MLCSKLHCQKSVDLIPFSYKIGRAARQAYPQHQMQYQPASYQQQTYPQQLPQYQVCAPPHQPYRATSLTRTSPPPQDHHRALGIALLYGPRGARFLMSEVPLYTCSGVVRNQGHAPPLGWPYSPRHRPTSGSRREVQGCETRNVCPQFCSTPAPRPSSQCVSE